MVTTNGCIKIEFEPTQWRSPSYFCWEWRWFFIPTRWTRKVVIYNYVLCWLYSMTKSVIIALFCSLYFAGFYCIGFSIKLVKNWVRIEEQVDFMRNLWEANSQKSHVRSTYWKLKSHARLSFRECLASKAFLWDTRETLPRGFLSVTFLPFTHTIYILITHKSMRRPFREKNPR